MILANAWHWLTGGQSQDLGRAYKVRPGRAPNLAPGKLAQRRRRMCGEFELVLFSPLHTHCLILTLALPLGSHGPLGDPQPVTSDGHSEVTEQRLTLEDGK